MEHQLSLMESRLGRREQELVTVMEDSKTAVKVERGRLISQHMLVSYYFGFLYYCVHLC